MSAMTRKPKSILSQPVPLKSKSFGAVQWSSFCKATGVKGFSFLISSQTRVEKTLWAVSILVGAYLTASDINTTWEHFTTGATATKLRLDVDKPFQIRRMAICLLINESLSIDRANLMMPQDDFEETRDILSIFARIKEELERTNRITHFPALLRNLSKTAHEIEENPRQMLRSLAYKYWCKIGMTATLISEPGPVFKEIWKCDEIQTSWFGPSPIEDFLVLCHNTPTIYNFSSRLDYLSISYDTSKHFLNVRVTTVFLEPDLVVNPDLENLMRIDMGYQTTYSVRRLGRYKMIPSTHYPCTMDSSQINCRLKLAENLIINQCGCQPLFSTFMSDKNYTQICNFALNKNQCSDKRDINTTMIMAQCMPECHRELYSFTPASYTKESSNITTLILYIDSFLYPILEEIPLMGVRQFMGQLGGNLNLWLGASFIVLLHLLTFIIRLPYSYLHKTE